MRVASCAMQCRGMGKQRGCAGHEAACKERGQYARLAMVAQSLWRAEAVCKLIKAAEHAPPCPWWAVLCCTQYSSRRSPTNEDNYCGYDVVGPLLISMCAIIEAPSFMPGAMRDARPCPSCPKPPRLLGIACLATFILYAHYVHGPSDRGTECIQKILYTLPLCAAARVSAAGTASQETTRFSCSSAWQGLGS